MAGTETDAGPSEGADGCDSSTSSLGGIMRSRYSIHCADEEKVKDLQARVKSLVADMGYQAQTPTAKQTSVLFHYGVRAVTGQGDKKMHVWICCAHEDCFKLDDQTGLLHEACLFKIGLKGESVRTSLKHLHREHGITGHAPGSALALQASQGEAALKNSEIEMMGDTRRKELNTAFFLIRHLLPWHTASGLEHAPGRSSPRVREHRLRLC